MAKTPRNRTNDPPSAASPSPVADRDDRACKGVDPVLFYPKHQSAYPKAAALCHRCPHEAECLTWALDTGQSFGMLGGKTPDERRLILAGR